MHILTVFNEYKNTHEYIFISVYQLLNIASCAIWLWNMVSYVKGRMLAKDIWKQDPEGKIRVQEGWELGVIKAPQWGTS